MDINEAITIANVLENPLETPVNIDEVRQVDPTLGKDSISSGIRAAIYGTLLVVAFMAFYYHRCGIIADLAMILNLLILLGVMCSIGTTLTLPGIAGVVLTVGMAVDANVLIYERLREEMGQGKSMRGAISAAYSRAFTTIFDSAEETSYVVSYQSEPPGDGTDGGGGQPDEQHGAGAAQARADEPVRQMIRVANPEWFAGAGAQDDNPREVGQRHCQHEQRREHGQWTRVLLRIKVRQDSHHREQVTDEMTAGVTEKGAGVWKVPGQKTRQRAAHQKRNRRHEIFAIRCRDDGELP